MRAFFLLVILSTVLCVSVSASSATFYVDGAVSSSGDGTSWETAFKRIQEGIDAASHGDTVIVGEGTYVESIHFDGKNIVLRSTDPLDPGVVGSTIIDGNETGSVVTFSGTETEACILSGFTIRNGRTLGFGGGICGAAYAYADETHATVRNNTITGNSGDPGGGVSSCDGTIQDNTITGNSAQNEGGGLYGCDGTIQNNTITGNSAGDDEDGGGLSWCGGTIQHNTIAGNWAGWSGGGLSGCDGTIQNNTITGNSARYGGGLSTCDGTIQNNTITGNSARQHGGGLDDCLGTVRNCIIWGNTAPTSPQIHESNIPTYTCIQDSTGDGDGNIGSEPRFLDLNGGEYRLQEGSPCIDAGYNDPALPARDIAGMHRIMFGGKSLTVDMGAYEFHIWPPTMNSEAAEVTLRWSSLTGETYSVYQSGDMLSWDILTGNVASAGDTVTTWIDSMGRVLPPGVRIRYYKVMENQ